MIIHHHTDIIIARVCSYDKLYDCLGSHLLTAFGQKVKVGSEAVYVVGLDVLCTVVMTQCIIG